MATHDLVVIGSGPGGYVAAIRAAQLGLKTVCVEREALGGVCLNVGCIPSKALIQNAEVLRLVKSSVDYGITVHDIDADYGAGVKRSRSVVDRLTKGIGALFRKNGVEYITGDASFVDAHTVAVDKDRVQAKAVVVATGARPATLPNVAVDGEVVVTYKEAILQTTLPERVVIIGGGAIGVEFGYVYNAYGVDVTIVELEPRILPSEDEEVSAALAKALQKQGIRLLTGAKVTAVKTAKRAARVEVDASGGAESLNADQVLVAVGIVPNTEGLHAEKAGVRLNRGFVEVNESMQAAEGIFAIGDVAGTMPLAHVAQAQGVFVAEHLAGGEPQPLDYDAMPRAVYCSPQVASMGLTERQARDRGRDVKVGKFPLIASGKALAVGEYEGFVKVVVDAQSGELVGAHLLGHEVTEMLGELSLARLLEGTNLEVGAVVHAHPTISEAIKEAALAADGRAVHV